MMNLFSAIELGKNSMMTQQQVFSIIGHNIANVNTPGYSRQVVDLENVSPSVIGLKDGGRGVNLLGIRSIRDRFIDGQITERKQYEGFYNTMSGLMSTVESLFDETHGLGLSDSLSNFFNAWGDVANNPTDMPTRNALVSKARSFALGMRNSFQRLTDQQEVIDANIGLLVDDINSITHEIAELNEEIAYAEGSGNPANDLLDQRERKIRDLADKIGINFYYEQGNHSVTIEVAGRPLVSFNQVNDLSVQRNRYNSNYYDLYVDQYGAPAFNITTATVNGQMGALIIARDGQTVNGAGTVLNYTAGAPYDTVQFSQAHGLSVGDLVTINGETRRVITITGSDEIMVESFTAGTVNNGDNWLERAGYIPEYKKDLNKLAAGLIQNVNNLHQGGYTLNGVTTTGQNFFAMSSNPAGITASVNAAGDTVTFAADVSTYISVGDVITINGETRLITNYNPGTFQAAVNPPLTGPVAAGASWQYSNVQGAANTLQVDSNIAADATLIAASSQPTQAAPFAVGNNDIARQIAALMDNNNVVDTDNDGTGDYGTFHEYLHSTFSEIGNTAGTANYELDANGSMLTYLENKRDSISGVSLDEEAATLMQFEKSFQALGQFMATVSQLTDLLMQIV